MSRAPRKATEQAEDTHVSQVVPADPDLQSFGAGGPHCYPTQTDPVAEAPPNLIHYAWPLTPPPVSATCDLSHNGSEQLQINSSESENQLKNTVSLNPLETTVVATQKNTDPETETEQKQLKGKEAESPEVTTPGRSTDKS